MQIPIEDVLGQTAIVCEIALVLCVYALSPTVRREVQQLFWRGRGAAKARTDADPLDVVIADLPRQGLRHRVDEWRAETRRGGTGLGFEDWLLRIAMPATVSQSGLRIWQDGHSFVIHHGARYVIFDTVRGTRTFECRIDGRLPVVAFIDDEGRRGPWIMIPKLFTVEEIVSMKPQTLP